MTHRGVYTHNIFAATRPEDEEKINGQYGLARYNEAVHSMLVDGNIYYNKA